MEKFHCMVFNKLDWFYYFEFIQYKNTGKSINTIFIKYGNNFFIKLPYIAH